MADMRDVDMWFFGASIVAGGLIEPNLETRRRIRDDMHIGDAVLCIRMAEWPTNDEDVHAVSMAFDKHLHELVTLALRNVVSTGDGKPN
jgi:hypothetical protein